MWPWMKVKANIINTWCIPVTEAVTVPSLMMITLVVSEESLARDTHTHTHTPHKVTFSYDFDNKKWNVLSKPDQKPSGCFSSGVFLFLQTLAVTSVFLSQSDSSLISASLHLVRSLSPQCRIFSSVPPKKRYRGRVDCVVDSKRRFPRAPVLR